MALPPEPIEEVLPGATVVIEGEVEAIVSTGAIQPKVDAPPGTTGTGKKVASQVVKLKVSKVHLGPAGLKEIVVEKPVSGYGLKAGNKGPFLLDGSKPHPVILGRYGPDTWAVDRIVQALKSAKK